MEKAKILLIDVDSKIPNLALMKLSTYYKLLGSEVELAYINNLPIKNYDSVYASIVFTKNKFQISNILEKYPQAEIGGSGTENYNKILPENIEHTIPDYELYNYNNRGKKFNYFKNISIGFTSRGCIRNCSFCIVNKKEGKIQDWSSIYEFWNKNHNTIMLLDNNFFANPNWKGHVNNILKENLFVIENGLDIRLVTDETAYYISKIKFRNKARTAKHIHFAFDNIKDEKVVVEGVKKLTKYIKPIYFVFYILVGYENTLEDDLYRINIIRNLGCRPYIMPYEKASPEQKILARYINQFLFSKDNFDFQGYLKKEMEKVNV